MIDIYSPIGWALLYFATLGVLWAISSIAKFIKGHHSKKEVRPKTRRFIKKRSYSGIDREVKMKLSKPCVDHCLENLKIVCESSESQMVLFVQDNEKMQLRTVFVGNEFDLINLISDATDKDPAAEETMQILTKYYTAKFQNDRS